jgi:AcrR family transcriptional regulator
VAGPAGSPRAVGEHFAGDLRQALLDAAVATLDEVGADRLSLREVARRAGVSHAAPAHHFTDKAGLLTAVPQAATWWSHTDREQRSPSPCATTDPSPG